MRRARTVSAPLLPGLLLALACSDEPLPTGSHPAGPPALALQSVPAAPPARAAQATPVGLVRTVHVLPPLGGQVQLQGSVDPTLLPVLAVEVCAWTGTSCGATIARFTGAGQGAQALRLDGGGGHYVATWDTRSSSLDPSKAYRLRVFLAGAEVRRANLRAVVGQPAAGTTTDLVVEVGSTVPIRVWVSRARLAGNGSPLGSGNAAIPRLAFVPRPQDYTTDHPRLRGMYLSFNTLLAVFAPAATVGEVNAALDAVDAEVVGGIPGKAQTPGILFLRTRARTHAEMEAALATLRRDAKVGYAVQDGLLGTAAVPRPNPVAFSGWAWETTPTGDNWGLELLRVPQMWNLNAAVRKANGSAVTGVLDAGFNDHVDLVYAANLSPGRLSDHGTHVAGTIGATFDNGLGVDGVNPFARLVVKAPVFAGITPDPYGDRVSWGLSIVWGLDSLIRARRDMRVVNVSLAYNWYQAVPAIDSDTDPAAQVVATLQGGVVRTVLQLLEADGVPLPVIVACAGNESGKVSATDTHDARYASPLTNAALAHGVAAIVVVESIARGALGGVTRSVFSSVNGHVSAPGSEIVSTIPGDAYGPKSGTSMAAPHVTGLVGYLYALDPLIPSPTLSTNVVRDLLVANGVSVGGGARQRVDAFATVMDLDRVRGGLRVLQKLLDIDDGSPDGNLRRTNSGVVEIREDIDGDGGVGDGQVDMSDFRRWRDWLLQVRNPAGLSLDGPADHPKKDVNGDGRVGTPAQENVYPRGDFNGDGRLDLTTQIPVRGVMEGVSVTDLQVLERFFSDPDYTVASLEDLINSGDIEADATRCLTFPGAASVRSSIRVTGTPDVVQSRTHGSTTPVRIYTAPANPAGYTASMQALNASGAVIASAQQSFPVTPGGDARFAPECVAPDLAVSFPSTLPLGATRTLTADVTRRDPVTGATTPLPNVPISISTSGGTVGANSGATDASGRFATTATLVAPVLTITVTATVPGGMTLTRTVTATAAATARVVPITNGSEVSAGASAFPAPGRLDMKKADPGNFGPIGWSAGGSAQYTNPGSFLHPVGYQISSSGSASLSATFDIETVTGSLRAVNGRGSASGTASASGEGRGAQAGGGGHAEVVLIFDVTDATSFEFNANCSLSFANVSGRSEQFTATLRNMNVAGAAAFAFAIDIQVPAIPVPGASDCAGIVRTGTLGSGRYKLEVHGNAGASASVGGNATSSASASYSFSMTFR